MGDRFEQLQVREATGGVTFGVKAVPGSSRARVQGLYGDQLKVAVTAAPERGRANAAICALLAEVLGVAARDVRVTAGGSSPRKQVTVDGLTADELRRRLAAT